MGVQKMEIHNRLHRSGFPKQVTPLDIKGCVTMNARKEKGTFVQRNHSEKDWVGHSSALSGYYQVIQFF